MASCVQCSYLLGEIYKYCNSCNATQLEKEKAVMNPIWLFLGDAVALRVAKDAIDIYDVDRHGEKVYRCALTVNAVQAGELIAVLRMVHQ